MKLNNIFRGIVLTAVIGSAVTGCTETDQVWRFLHRKDSGWRCYH